MMIDDTRVSINIFAQIASVSKNDLTYIEVNVEEGDKLFELRKKVEHISG